MQNRREFIKRTCTLCAGIAGLGILTSQLTGCNLLPICKGEECKGMISVPLISFTDKINMIIVRNNQLDYDILLIKIDENNYNALQMKCTHQDNPLIANQTGLYCSAHGSTYDLEGKVTKEPALSPLKKFKTEKNNSSILIDVRS